MAQATNELWEKQFRDAFSFPSNLHVILSCMQARKNIPEALGCKVPTTYLGIAGGDPVLNVHTFMLQQGVGFEPPGGKRQARF